MIYLLSIIHVLACVFIVLFILLQDPKGGVLGVLGGGGGSKSLFGSGGASQFLVDVTKWLAFIFVVTSVALSYLSSNNQSDLMLKEPPSVEAPLKEPLQTPQKTNPAAQPSSQK